MHGFMDGPFYDFRINQLKVLQLSNGNFHSIKATPAELRFTMIY